MKILKSKVSQNNKLQLLVDHIPDLDELTFEKHPDYQFWFSELNGYAKFFANPDGSGCEGASFKLNTSNGPIILQGPYSSSATFANQIGYGPVVDAELTTDPKAFERGWTFVAGSITVGLITLFKREQEIKERIEEQLENVILG